MPQGRLCVSFHVLGRIWVYISSNSNPGIFFLLSFDGGGNSKFLVSEVVWGGGELAKKIQLKPKLPT